MLQFRLFVRMRKAVEQLGLFGGPTSVVRPHVRHTHEGKVVQVKRHQRKRAPLTVEQISAIKRKQSMAAPLTDEEAQNLREHQAWMRAQILGQKQANERLARDGILEGRPSELGGGARSTRGWNVYPETDGTDRLTWLGTVAMHPDGQVKIVIDLKGRATLHKLDADGQWQEIGPLAERTNARVEADLVAREQREKHGPLSEHRAAEARAENEAMQPVRERPWSSSLDQGWATVWNKAKDHLRHTQGIGEVRFRRTPTEPKPGVKRIAVEVYRHTDGEVVGRGIAVDSTGLEPDGTAALWQLPNGAAVETPDGKQWRIEWGDLERTPGEPMEGKNVVLRPLGRYGGMGTHLDATTIVKRLDEPERAEELTATAALQHAVQQAIERAHGHGEPLPQPPWPPKPSRGERYGPEELRGVLLSRTDAPEVEQLGHDVRAWQREMRRKVGDYAFEQATKSTESFVPDPRRAVLDWRDHYQHQFMFTDTNSEKVRALAKPEAIQASWDKFWTDYQADARQFLATASDPKLYDSRQSSADYVVEHLMPEEGGSQHWRARQMAHHLLELRGYRFGKRYDAPEWYDVTGPAAWDRLKERTRPSHRAGLVLEGEGGVRSAKSADAVAAFKAWQDRLGELGDNPHHALVEKNRYGGFRTVDPITGERMRDYDTRREARERMEQHLRDQGEKLARAAGSAAVAGPVASSPAAAPAAPPPPAPAPPPPAAPPVRTPPTTTAKPAPRKLIPSAEIASRPPSATTATTAGAPTSRELLRLKGHELRAMLTGPHAAVVQAEIDRRDAKRAGR